MKYMTHPKHGRMPVYTPQEIEHNQKNGWILDGDNQQNLQAQVVPAIEAEPFQATSTKSPEINAERANAIETYLGKFGKKPHHRLSTENILKAIHANGG